MNRRGAALATALVVMLAAGLVAATALAVAVGELRAGQAWIDRGRAARLAATGLVTAMTEPHSDLDTLAAGAERPLGSGEVVARRLGGLVFRLDIEGRFREGSERVEALAVWDPASERLRPILDRSTTRPPR